MNKCIVKVPNSKRRYVCANVQTAINVAKRHEGANIKFLDAEQSEQADIMAGQHRNKS